MNTENEHNDDVLTFDDFLAQTSGHEAIKDEENALVSHAEHRTAAKERIRGALILTALAGAYTSGMITESGLMSGVSGYLSESNLATRIDHQEDDVHPAYTLADAVLALGRENAEMSIPEDTVMAHPEVRGLMLNAVEQSLSGHFRPEPLGAAIAMLSMSFGSMASSGPGSSYSYGIRSVMSAAERDSSLAEVVAAIAAVTAVFVEARGSLIGKTAQEMISGMTDFLENEE